MAILGTSTDLTAQVVVDTAQASQAESMEHGGATYGARKVKSKGRTYTQLTINDTKTMRRYRYFFSLIKAIGGAIKRLFQGKSVRPYLDGYTAHLRKNLSETDKRALSAVKAYGTQPNENLDESTYGQNVMFTGIANKKNMNDIVESIIEAFSSNNVVKNGFYEIQLGTCIPGIIKEPHAVSLVIDPLRQQFYLMDTKGTNPEDLHFYCGFGNSRSVSELTVIDFIEALKEKGNFKDYGLVVTPSFQKVGDCVPGAEAMTRSLAAVRQNLVDKDKLSSVAPNYEIMAALATVYENYEELVTEGVRAKLET